MSQTKPFDIYSVDWVKYLERKRLFSIYFAFIDIERKLLEEVTGFRFYNHLYTYQNDLGSHYRSVRELALSDAYYIDLVNKKDPRIKEWRDRGLKWNERADELIEMFTDETCPVQIPAADFKKYYDEFLQILLYGATIPFVILSAINAEIEKGNRQKYYDEVVELFEPLRSVSKYPGLQTSMMEYFFVEIAKLAKIADHKLLYVATPVELEAFIAEKPTVSVKELMQRKEWCVFWNNTDKDYIEFSYDKTITEKIPVLGGVAGTTKDAVVKGSVAYKGKVSGRVCIVLEASEMAKFKEGDVLVSNCTNPSLMPVIRICGAIVTDEGGIMCHAAIVSRELKKPCIIGTKNATKVFKDGDLVEVDAEKGIVKMLSK